MPYYGCYDKYIIQEHITNYQCRMTPAIIKMFVSMYDNTITVRMQAIRSASASELPAFSPNALAQLRQKL